MNKRKKRRRREPVPLLQLCLFDEQVMQQMIEQPADERPADPRLIAGDSNYLQWQLVIGEALRGEAWRRHRAMLIAKKPVMVVKTKTGHPVRAPGFVGEMVW